jgi:hypothetical protein
MFHFWFMMHVLRLLLRIKGCPALVCKYIQSPTRVCSVQSNIEPGYANQQIRHAPGINTKCHICPAHYFFHEIAESGKAWRKKNRHFPALVQSLFSSLTKVTLSSTVLTLGAGLRNAAALACFGRHPNCRLPSGRWQKHLWTTGVAWAAELNGRRQTDLENKIQFLKFQNVLVVVALLLLKHEYPEHQNSFSLKARWPEKVVNFALHIYFDWKWSTKKVSTTTKTNQESDPEMV